MLVQEGNHVAEHSLYPDRIGHTGADRMVGAGFFTSDEIPVLIRVAVGVIGLGMLILIGVAIKDRISKAKGEHFEGVDK